jgi:hypothetical protein
MSVKYIDDIDGRWGSLESRLQLVRANILDCPDCLPLPYWGSWLSSSWMTRTRMAGGDLPFFMRIKGDHNELRPRQT